MLIKVLVENTDSDICKGEHGLSLYVEYKDKKYLIDSGASSLFAENADKMGVPLDQVDMAFLSHAHYDHSSGYPEFFKRNHKAYIGGFHMMGMSGAGSTSYSQEEIHAVSRKLLASSDAIFYSGHCTGTVAFEWLKEILNNRLEAIASGQVIRISTNSYGVSV